LLTQLAYKRLQNDYLMSHGHTYIGISLKTTKAYPILIKFIIIIPKQKVGALNAGYS